MRLIVQSASKKEVLREELGDLYYKNYSYILEGDFDPKYVEKLILIMKWRRLIGG
jgi:hypothetical protein